MIHSVNCLFDFIIQMVSEPLVKRHLRWVSDMVHPELLKDVQHGASDTQVTLKKIQKTERF